MKRFGLVMSVMLLVAGLNFGTQAAAQTGIVRGQTNPAIDAIQDRARQVTASTQSTASQTNSKGASPHSKRRRHH